MHRLIDTIKKKQLIRSGGKDLDSDDDGDNALDDEQSDLDHD
jgi:hypothetical protein